MMTPTRLKKLCNKCGILTNQIVLHHKDTVGELVDGDPNSWCRMDYTLLQCLGCDAVSLHETFYGEDPSDALELRYPPAAARRIPAWANSAREVPIAIRRFLFEIYAALHNGSYRLCAIGIRALIEDIMIDRIGGDRGTIGENINAFLAMGYVATQSMDDFKARVVEAGNAAIHRGHEPSGSDIEALLNITESLIASIYIHPQQIRAISEVPPRVRRPKSNEAK